MKSAAYAVALAVLAPLAAQSDERPPAKSLPMAEIVAKVEKAGYAPIVDVSFDDGQWEVEAVKDRQQFELSVDPATGEIRSTHADDADAAPASDDLPLAKILGALTKDGWSPVVEASFEHRGWEVEAYKDDAKHELQVDAKSGKITRDRRDD